MPRTAVTTGITHEGEDVTIFGRAVPVSEQLAAWRKILGNKSDEKYAEVHYQESDGQMRVIRFRKPEDQAAFEAQQVKDRKAHEDSLKANEDKRRADAVKQMEVNSARVNAEGLRITAEREAQAKEQADADAKAKTAKASRQNALRS